VITWLFPGTVFFGWDRWDRWYCRQYRALLVGPNGGTGGTTIIAFRVVSRSHWSHPAVPPFCTKILCSTTGPTGPTP
jgi:hypothetical protein